MSEGAFEAKLAARRETREGIFLTLSVNPADFNADLAMVRVGSALQIGWAEILDVEVHKIEVPTNASPQAAGGHARAAALSPEQRTAIASKAAETRWNKPEKERTPFAKLPASQRAAMLCNGEQFWNFLIQKHYDVWDRFYQENRSPAYNNDHAAEVVRTLCGVKSRADINEQNPTALERWNDLESRYRQWETDQQYAEARR